MLKKGGNVEHLITLLLFITINYSHFAHAQVGIGTSTIGNDAILEVSSANKGILLPNIDIDNISTATPVETPANYLTAYNKNENHKSFYYWNGTVWKPLVDLENVASLISLTTSFVKENSGFLDLDSTTGANSYQKNDPPGTTWKAIPNLKSTFTVSKTSNNINVNVEGMIQANNTTISSSGFSYSVAIFLDNSLHSVRNFIVTSNSFCSYDFYSINANINNLTLGEHTIEAFATVRVNFSNASTSKWRFSGIFNGCTNLNSDMTESLMTIKLTQSN
ncbi:hypothetical protein UJ101_01774 [Flavobacteriaceae bacterium UJ101]|nr:hypothetical protein UJ101_01774 [Flavobacteriaceae bacterium UJ101]